MELELKLEDEGVVNLSVKYSQELRLTGGAACLSRLNRLVRLLLLRTQLIRELFSLKYSCCATLTVMLVTWLASESIQVENL